MSKYAMLFQPMKIGNMEIKNRIVVTAMGIHSHRLINSDGSFTEDGKVYYETFAKGGSGLIVTGAMPVQNMFDVAHDTAATMATAGPAYVESMKEFTDRMHKYGTKVVTQLSAGSGRTLPYFIAGGRDLIGPSDDLPNFWDPCKKHRALTREEIQMYIDGFGKGAKVAKEAGFDGVEIHAVHEGYLMDQFTQSICNKRTDEYGGSLEGRLLFAKRVVEAIKASCGEDYPVIMRYSVRSMMIGFNKGAIPGQDFVEAGRDLNESIQVAKLLESYGYDALDADNGTYDSWWYAHPPVYMPEGCNLEDCAIIKKEVKIPVICAGRMENPALALDAVASGKVDAVGLARQVLADPQWPNKVQNEQEDDIRFCIACHAGCLNQIFKGKDLCCALNPSVARETAYQIKPAENKKKIMVIGGGIGGMEAARVSALRGHEVDLFEKTDQLGGMFIPASAMSFKESDRKLIEWYKRQMKNLDINIQMSTEVTDERIRKENPDVIFMATGSKAKKLPVSGADAQYVISAVDALNHPEKIKGEVVVIGCGLTGTEIAYDYAKNGGKVTIVEACDTILNVDIAAANKNYLLAAIDVYGIDIFKNAMVESFEDEKVTFTQNGEKKSLHADTIIVSIGYDSYHPLEINLNNVEHHVIGDAENVSNLMGAIWNAYATAMVV